MDILAINTFLDLLDRQQSEQVVVIADWPLGFVSCGLGVYCDPVFLWIYSFMDVDPALLFDQRKGDRKKGTEPLS